MRLSFRFIIPLVIALALIAYAVMPLVDRLTRRWFNRDLESRSSLIVNTVHAQLEDLFRSGDQDKIRQFFAGIARDERVYAIAYCSSPGATALSNAPLPPEVRCSNLDALSSPSGHLLASAHGPLHVSVKPFKTVGAPDGKLVLIHDMSFVVHRTEQTRRYLFFFFIGLGAIVSLITVIIAQLSWRGWVQGLRALLHVKGRLRPSDRPASPELRPIAHDLHALIEDLQAEYQAGGSDRLTWTPEALREILHSELSGQEIIVVANREPYIHVREGDSIVVQRPASGLVTALEPIMRACSGTWIAHGSGSADREVVDKHDRVAVPPDNPTYQIRRLWLSAEEEAGYYYGFANEGLWPLCHIAHVRPTFRSSDWEQYVKVNRKFADAVEQESASSEPIVLVQDYHFALLPRMIREALPGATVITFWHIPWPNPEAFGICPWREEVLDGLLGSSILAFHTQFHCNNFVDTVDRLLEARVDRDTFTVSYRRSLTTVKRYPISVEWPPSPLLVRKPVEQSRREVRERHHLLPDQRIGVGVDRLDYTKGIEERLRAVERLLELWPEWIGRFTFIQIAAPSRTSIQQYQDYEARVRAMAAGINDRFADAAFPPVILKVGHYEPREVYEYFRAAELCFVSSLHDGMNLVSKEFISARDDERGVLILSQFTGAARELPEAIIVNPYDTEECAEALHMALSMPVAEQGKRMRIMRSLVRDFNVYRWAGKMLLDAASMRRSGHLLERAGARRGLPGIAAGAGQSRWR